MKERFTFPTPDLNNLFQKIAIQNFEELLKWETRLCFPFYKWRKESVLYAPLPYFLTSWNKSWDCTRPAVQYGLSLRIQMNASYKATLYTLYQVYEGYKFNALHNILASSSRYMLRMWYVHVHVCNCTFFAQKSNRIVPRHTYTCISRS